MKFLAAKKAAHKETHCTCKILILAHNNRTALLRIVLIIIIIVLSPHLLIYLFVPVSLFVCSLTFLCFSLLSLSLSLFLSPLSVTLFVSLSLLSVPLFVYPSLSLLLSSFLTHSFYFLSFFADCCFACHWWSFPFLVSSGRLCTMFWITVVGLL
jgi:hypothetical protein